MAQVYQEMDVPIAERDERASCIFSCGRLGWGETYRSMKKILLVEDDSMIVEIYRRRLVASGFDVSVATAGKAALDTLRTDHFDLVLLDIVLPEMGGLEILERLRDPKEGYDPKLPIFMFSNVGESEDRSRAISLGANGFIAKTEFSPSRLAEEIARMFSDKTEMREFSGISSESQKPTIDRHNP